MKPLFNPKVRDRAIETVCSNLIMAGGIITPGEVASFMAELAGYDNIKLAGTLIESRILLDEYLVKRWSEN